MQTFFAPSRDPIVSCDLQTILLASGPFEPVTTIGCGCDVVACAFAAAGATAIKLVATIKRILRIECLIQRFYWVLISHKWPKTLTRVGRRAGIRLPLHVIHILAVLCLVARPLRLCHADLLRLQT